MTSIRETYTLSNTTPEVEGNPEDQFTIQNFLRILAEVALSIASKKKPDEPTHQQNSTD